MAIRENATGGSASDRFLVRRASRHRPDPARIERVRLEYSDLSPLTCGDAPRNEAHLVRGEHRGLCGMGGVVRSTDDRLLRQVLRPPKDLAMERQADKPRRSHALMEKNLQEVGALLKFLS